MPDNNDPQFHRFESAIDAIALPLRFTYPFYYQPHALSELAAAQLQRYLTTQQDWQHNFGLNTEDDLSSAIGKMFGVLVVENQHGELGFLQGFSGKLANQNLHSGFVPPVFDMLVEDSFFLPEQTQINALTAEMAAIQQDATFIALKAALAQAQNEYAQALAAHKQVMQQNRQQRKTLRQQAAQTPSESTSELLKQLSQESVHDKLALRDLKLHWDALIAELELQTEGYQAKFAALKTERAARSHDLQHHLFAQYRFLNAKGKMCDLNELFADSALGTIPAGAGECAAPKLLQYAYQQGYRPIAMAEFWWGRSPKSEIRRHGQFYPSCQGKCKPILTHMLEGLEVDDNPLAHHCSDDFEVEIVYADAHMAVVNKPAEFLSVPGKTITDSVYSRMQARFPEATGPLIVHRLDMSTSGLMVIALSERANKHLQQQFIQRSAEKRYCALVEGEVEGEQGTITLPLRGDLYDRPRQLVCFEHGKPAETYWQVIARTNNRTKLWLYPKTGRTHQLRVHCAHPMGLNLPMVGDDLYGVKAERLYLHAELLVLNHPISQERMTFEAPAPF
ncbi:hypothetical protein VST7929_02988 [Vibrio stylophorae]|uniref:Pseudouridine synthase RsuA/RluA-like domain-containing protein n=1 Tax=Vibrio stylophorae TaxID=659351 RepID=A0ABM8ZXF9_9VIBR|nr:RluA family pseudouridine synthase [Vibrio stylophorae]CAH0535415.1 hypothetical protein VST7929_02988 [Vibrio stylophorae]